MKKLQLTLIFILLSLGNIFGQETKCEKIKQIDSLEFEQHKVPFSQISRPNSILKTDKTLKIRTADSLLTFIDDLSDESFFGYSYLGEFEEEKLTLVLGEDYNQDYYYLIDQISSKIDSLVGYPKIFNNKILAVEGAYTDGSALIEIWSIEDSKIKKIKSFSLKDCMIYSIQDAFLRNGWLYLRNSYTSAKDDYYKIKLK